MAARTSRTRRRAPARTRGDWRPAFLEALKRTGMVSAAAAAAGVGRRTVYDHRKVDEAFAEQWDDVVEDALEEMEAEAYRRAVVGVHKPVFHAGQLVGTIREYSDQLLIFLLRARRPEKYSERYRVQHAVSLEKRPPVIDITDPEVQARSHELLRAVAAARDRNAIPPDRPVRLGLAQLDDDDLAALEEAAAEAGEIVE